MQKKVVVIHYMPLELYPPVMNLVNAWSKYNGSPALDVYTTGTVNALSEFNALPGKTRIYRFGRPGKGQGFVRRMAQYLFFYLSSFFRLLLARPTSVLYYDSISSFPAILYKKFINRRCRLFVHYNEYMSPEEYRSGMFLVRYFHRMERKMYGKVSWLSHTNEARMKLFLADMPGIEIPRQHILPNYPPLDWSVGKGSEPVGLPARIVYTGAFSMDTMYTQLFAEWVLRQNGAVTWDIYSLNATADAEQYIQSLPGSLVRLHQGVDYFSLPLVLHQYDIGVILYNGHIPNYIYNAPNKLFEYAVCGLDVWFPDHMESSMPYVTDNTYPKIIPLNFASLNGINAEQLVNRNNCTFKQAFFACETVLLPLFEKLSA